MTNASNTNEYNTAGARGSYAGTDESVFGGGATDQLGNNAHDRNAARAIFRGAQEERIRTEFGEQFTEAYIKELRDELLGDFSVPGSLASNRDRYARDMLNPYEMGIRNFARTAPSEREFSTRSVALLPEVRSLGDSSAALRNKALNSYCFWSFDRDDRNSIDVDNTTAPPERQGPAAVMPDQIRNAQLQVPATDALREMLTQKIQSSLAEAVGSMGDLARDSFGDSIRDDLRGVKNFFGLDPAPGYEMSAGTLSVADLTLDNFYWFYYSVYQNRRYITPISDPAVTAGPAPSAPGLVIDIYGDEGMRINQLVALYAAQRGRDIALQIDNELIEQSIRSPDPGIDGATLTEGGSYDANARAYAEQALTRVGGDGTEDLDAEQLARLKRLAEQAFLIDYLPEFAALNQNKRTPLYADPQGRRYFSMVHGQTDTIVNKLLYNGSIQSLEKLLPSEISGLVPQIRLYKIFYDILENGQRGATYEQEVPFEAHVDPQSITSMTNTGIQRGEGAGIVSFDWKLEGQNPFTARRDIYAELKLYFQSMEDFIRRVNLPTVGRGNRPFSYVDLVNIGLVEKTTALAWNPDYFKLKIETGWVPPAEDVFVGTAEERQEKQAAVKASRMSMYLTAIDHNIEVNEFGNVSLTIEYIAWQEGSYFDADSDVLADRNALTARLLRRKKLLDAAATCNEDYIASLTREYQLKIRDEKYNSWQRIMKELYQNNRIFYVPVNTVALNSYINHGRTNFKGIRGLLQNPASPSPINNLNLAAASGEADIEAHLGVTPPAEGQEEDTILKRLTELTYDDAGVQTSVQFFYFGDLMEIALSNISETLANAPPGTDVQGKLDKKMRFIMGPISFKKMTSNADMEMPTTAEQIQRLRDGQPPAPEPESQSSIVYNINIADIPISVNYFVEWFINQALSQERSFYPFLAFVRDLASKLIRSVMSEQGQSFQNIARQNLQLRTLFFSGKAGRDEGGNPEDLLEDRMNVLPIGSDQCCGGAPEGTYSRIDLDDAFNYNRTRLRGSPLLTRPDRGDEAFHYMLMYAITTEAAQNLEGDPVEDAQKGIYHLAIAQDRGILKKVDFTKTNIAGLREARFENDLIGSATGLSILANVYDIKVKMVGNTGFYPGMKMFLDPAGLGGNIGSPTKRGDPAYKLGIGGYHTIYRVESYIESGKFETTLHAIFEGTGGPAALGFNSPNETAEVEEDPTAESGPSSVSSPDNNQCNAATQAVDLLFGKARRSAEG